MTFLELSLSRSLNVSADVRQRFSGTLTRRTASRLLFKADRDEGRLVNLAHVDTLHLEKRGAHGIIEIVDTGTYSNPPLAQWSEPQEQYGNNLERKTAQMIPNDPKSALL